MKEWITLMKEKMKMFYERIEQDEQLQQRLSNEMREIEVHAHDRIVSLGAERGYHFTREELEKELANRLDSFFERDNDELDDSELEAVAGGSVILLGPLTLMVVGTVVASAGSLVYTALVIFDDRK